MEPPVAGGGERFGPANVASRQCTTPPFATESLGLGCLTTYSKLAGFVWETQMIGIVQIGTM